MNHACLGRRTQGVPAGDPSRRIGLLSGEFRDALASSSRRTQSPQAPGEPVTRGYPVFLGGRL
jgi:hypothetical protein